MDPVLFLTTSDPTLRVVMQGIAREADEFQRKLDDERAIKISNAVAKMLGGKS